MEIAMHTIFKELVSKVTKLDDGLHSHTKFFYMALAGQHTDYLMEFVRIDLP